MKKKVSGKAAKRVGAISLALAMALSTSAFAAQPNVIFLKGADNQLHGFNLQDLALSTSGSALRLTYQKYIEESIQNNNSMYAQVGTGEEGRFVEFNPFTASGSFVSTVQTAPALPAEQVPTTYSAVTIDPVTGGTTEVVEELTPDNPVVLEVTPIVATVGTTFEAVTPFKLTPVPTATVTWTITGLPSEFKYDTLTGAISLVSGSAPTAEVSSSSITVTAAFGLSEVTNTTTITVYPVGTVVRSITLSDITAVAGTEITPVTATLTPAPSGTVAWTATGLPAGLTMSAVGIISGTPTTAASAASVTVSATVDGVTVSKNINVTVTAAVASTVTSVVVTPATTTAALGSNVQFSAVVDGTNNPAQTVTWSVSGAAVTTTTMSATGILTIGADETATELTVIATSTVDTNVSGSAIVTVSSVPGTIAVSSIALVNDTTIEIATADNSATTISAADFDVTVGGTKLTIASADIEVTSTLVTITIPALDSGDVVTVATKNNLEVSNKEFTYSTIAISGTVTGYALSDDGKTVTLTSLSGVTATLVNAYTNADIETVKTGTNGSYTFLNAAAGTYNIQFSKTGYSTTPANSYLLNIPVTTASVSDKDFALKSIDTTIISTNATVVAVEGTVAKVKAGTTADGLKAALALKYGPVATGIKILQSSSSTTEVTGATVVTTANAISVTAEDGVTKAIPNYTIAAADAEQLLMLGVKFDTAVAGAAGTVSLSGTTEEMHYSIGVGGISRSVAGATVNNIEAEIGDVIRVWIGEYPAPAGKFVDLTITKEDIVAPAQVVVAENQVTKKGGKVNVRALDSIGIQLYISTESAKADFVAVSANRLVYSTNAPVATLPAEVASGDYYIYAVHVATGVVSAPSEVFEVDNVIPVITKINDTRTSITGGSITFSSTKGIDGGTKGIGYFVKFDGKEAPTIAAEDVINLTGAAVSTTSTNFSSWVSGDNILGGGVPEIEAPFVTIVAVDKAGNMSAPLSFQLKKYVAPLSDGIYTVLTKGATTNGALAIYLTDTSTVKAGDKTWVVGSDSIAAVQGLLPSAASPAGQSTLTSGDSFTIASGKVTRINHVGTSDATITVPSAYLGTKLTLSGSATSLFTVKGDAGQSNVEIVEGDNKLDLTHLTLSPSALGTTDKGTIILAGAQNLNIKVANGARIKTSAGNVAILNDVAFTSGTNPIYLESTDATTFKVYESTNSVTINAVSAAAANVVVNFAQASETSQQTGLLAVTGPTVASGGSLKVVTPSRTENNKVEVLGGTVDVSGYVTASNGDISYFTVSGGAIATKITAGTRDLTVATNAALQIVSARDALVIGNTTFAAAQAVTGDWTVSSASLSVSTTAGITIAAGKTLTVTGGSLTVKEGGLNVSGTLSVTGSSLNISTTNAAVTLNSGSTVTTISALKFTNSTQGALNIMSGAKFTSGSATLVVTNETVVSSASADVKVGVKGAKITTGSTSKAAVGTATDMGILTLQYIATGYRIVITESATTGQIAKIEFVEIQ